MCECNMNKKRNLINIFVFIDGCKVHLKENQKSNLYILEYQLVSMVRSSRRQLL